MQCPKCGSEDVRNIVYGYLPFDLARQKEDGKLVYGGLFMPENAPAHECAECGERW